MTTLTGYYNKKQEFIRQNMLKAITDLHVNDVFIAKFILLTGGKALPGIGKNERNIIPLKKFPNLVINLKK